MQQPPRTSPPPIAQPILQGELVTLSDVNDIDDVVDDTIIITLEQRSLAVQLTSEPQGGISRA